MEQKYIMFMLHDPIGNIESQITDFDPEMLKSAAMAGMIFIGVKSDGGREIVPIEEVRQPDIGSIEGVPIVLPSYVESRIDEVMNVIQEVVSAISESIPKKQLVSIQESISDVKSKAKNVLESEQETLKSISTKQ